MTEPDLTLTAAERAQLIASVEGVPAAFSDWWASATGQTEPPAPEPPATGLPAPNPAQGSSGRGNPLPDAGQAAQQFVEWVQDAPRGQGMWTDQHGNRHP